MAGFLERLADGDLLLLDGGMGTELVRRGVPRDEAVWGAMAPLTHPDIIREAHADFIRAGADIIITNSFFSSRSALAKAGLQENTEEANRNAVALASEAIEVAAPGRNVYVAGSISYWGTSPDDGPDEQRRARENYREQARILLDSGADLLALEMLSWPENAEAILVTADESGAPFMAGFSTRISADGAEVLMSNTHRDNLLEPEIEKALAYAPDVVAIMHTEFEDVERSLEVVRRHWSGPLGVYPHSGTFRDTPTHEPTISSQRFAEEGAAWVGVGVRLVGGCCGVGPDYIDGLSARLRPDNGNGAV